MVGTGVHGLECCNVCPRWKQQTKAMSWFLQAVWTVFQLHHLPLIFQYLGSFSAGHMIHIAEEEKEKEEQIPGKERKKKKGLHRNCRKQYQRRELPQFISRCSIIWEPWYLDMDGIHGVWFIIIIITFFFKFLIISFILWAFWNGVQDIRRYTMHGKA